MVIGVILIILEIFTNFNVIKFIITYFNWCRNRISLNSDWDFYFYVNFNPIDVLGYYFQRENSRYFKVKLNRFT